MITTLIITAFLCIIGLALISTSEKWNKNTKPPNGWIQYKGYRNKVIL